MTRDKARKLYEAAIASGRDPAIARQVIKDMAAREAQAPAPEVPVEAPAPTPEAPPAQSAADVRKRLLMQRYGGAAPQPSVPAAPTTVTPEMIKGHPFWSGVLESGLSTARGAAQMVEDNPEALKRVADAERSSRQAWEQEDPTGSGFSMGDLGKAVGYGAQGLAMGGPVGAAARGLGMGAGAAALAGSAGAGAIQGAATPTLGPDESRAKNAVLGGTIGGVLHGALGTVGSITGRYAPDKAAVVDYLRNLGIKLPEGSKYESSLANALGNIVGKRGHISPSNESATEYLARQAGGQADILSNNMELEAHTKHIGKTLGDLFKGETVYPHRYRADYLDPLQRAYNQYHTGFTPSEGSQVESLFNQMADIYIQKQPITGDAYQAMRSKLGRLSVKGEPEEQVAAKSMQNILDNLFHTKTATGQTDLASLLRGQYGLSKTLRNRVPIVPEGNTAGRVLRGVEQEAKKRQVNPEVREAMSKLASISPHTRIGGAGEVAAGAKSPMEEAVERGVDNFNTRGLLSILFRGAAAPFHSLGETGLVQKLSGALVPRQVRGPLSAAVRGYGVNTGVGTFGRGAPEEPPPLVVKRGRQEEEED